jgi:hypothetical protein
MTNSLVTIDLNKSDIVLSAKTGKTGSYAKAIAFGDRQARLGIASDLYVKQFANGMYRPLVNDLLSSTLLSKAVIEVVQVGIPKSGPLSKGHLEALCLQVDASVQVKKFKAQQKDKVFELKGQNAFLYGMVERILESTRVETIEA